MDDSDEKLEYYMSIGAIELEGMDEDGEIVYSISEMAKEIAPELWESHTEHIDSALVALFEQGLLDVEYDENLEATITLTEEGKEIAKEYGLIELFNKDVPND